MNVIESKLAKHAEFWERRNSEPLFGYMIGDYFVSRRYRGALPLMSDKAIITPEMIVVEDFAEDYLRAFDESGQVDQDILFTGVPFPGIPWIEAMFGCTIVGSKQSFIAKARDGVDMESISRARINTRWVDKYLEFTAMLASLGAGRFPVGQPILRGPVDLAGALCGESRLIYEMVDHPGQVSRIFDAWTKFYLDLSEIQRELIESYHGGYSIGFYDLWCPGDCIWYQDDLSALLSPDIYSSQVIEYHHAIVSRYEYSLFHLHPASFFIVDLLLSVDQLRAIQINKDTGGPGIAEMMPIFRKVLEHKNLVVWGDLTTSEVQMLNQELAPAGLAIIVAVSTVDDAVRFR